MPTPLLGRALHAIDTLAQRLEDGINGYLTGTLNHRYQASCQARMMPLEFFIQEKQASATGSPLFSSQCSAQWVQHCLAYRFGKAGVEITEQDASNKSNARLMARMNAQLDAQLMAILPAPWTQDTTATEDRCGLHARLEIQDGDIPCGNILLTLSPAMLEAWLQAARPASTAGAPACVQGNAISIMLQATLPQAPLSLEKILRLKAGSIIPIRNISTVMLHVARQPILQASLQDDGQQFCLTNFTPLT